MKLTIAALSLAGVFIVSEVAKADVIPSAPEQALGVEYGLIANTNPDGSRGWFLAPGVHYGHRLLDEISFDAGFATYAVSNYARSGDAYLVDSTFIVLNYSIPFGKDFRLIPYAGIRKNFVSSAAGSNDGATLSTVYASIGGGLNYAIGGLWNARINAGIDGFTGGLVVQF